LIVLRLTKHCDPGHQLSGILSLLLGLPETPPLNKQWERQFDHLRLVKRYDSQPSTIVRVLDIEIGGPDFVVMAQPCCVVARSNPAPRHIRFKASVWRG
jgi:hypothetical protein